ncbi:mediator of RNA polymerase II transcription subunit 26 [Drosophila busckii]|uniref:mediator of RNA polymerase II transcription subunit 26 n=1 Tax=Drosophila busckii TaxID=30019 RepID=UPI00083EDE1B|nr:mediator of RNA polymerase II transcription subunit 26 [Drosophila busckii]
MNQNQIQQLTSNLSQALDQNYDVVDMDAVLSVICALEGTTITKEQLEATRLAKYINQLRRRTKNEQLARRAKSLLKKWREMVGIQQTTSDSQPLQILPQTSIANNNASQPESDTNHSLACATLQYSLQTASPPRHRAISDLHSNVYSSAPAIVAIANNPYEQQQANFPTFDISNNGPFKAVKIGEEPLRSTDTCRQNEDLSNANKQNNESIIIDIASDSDEYEGGSQQKLIQATSPAISIPMHGLTNSVNVSPRSKKIKKEKKRKEKDGRAKPCQREDFSQLSQNIYSVPAKSEGHMSNAYPAYSEILSLSNSSISSMFPGDAVSTTPTKFRPTTTSLTFAGRFKCVAQSSDSLNIEENNQTTIEHSLPLRGAFDEYINNESNTSCSRFSPFNEQEAKTSKTHFQPLQTDDANKQQFSAHIPLPKPQQDCNLEYNENAMSQVPKKRGRKRGSKGVDSVIAKESSLSQKIFFGSGVKKVKTTKELFNEIQSRKLSLNRGDSLPAASKNLNLTSRSQHSKCLLRRPTSSCSDTSIHSPQTMDANSTNSIVMVADKFSSTVEDTGNTDSDTITSEPSRDSMKSIHNKRRNSADSNTNSLHTYSAKNIAVLTSSNNHNDVTTSHLLQLIQEMKNPLSVEETEKLYQSQIVPCTCTIIEELPQSSSGQANLNDLNNDIDCFSKSNCIESKRVGEQHSEKHIVSCSGTEEAKVAPVIVVAAKPMKSIFDLDFDEDEDPLHTIVTNISPLPAASVDLKQVNQSNTKSISNSNSILNKASTKVGGIEMVQQQKISNQKDKDSRTDEIVPGPLPELIIQEDPHCIAKQRFCVQTNEITNFHINALHNFYIPNINGNWDSIDTKVVVKANIMDFLQSLESYTVSDGSDVVTKYGSLTYERIRKDLSCLQLTRSFKNRSFNSYLTPFLGIAKCLPSCQRAAKQRRRVKINSSTSSRHTSMNPEEILGSTQGVNSERLMDISPLRVDVDDNLVDHVKISLKDPYEFSGSSSWNNRRKTLGSTLLKVANNNTDTVDIKVNQILVDQQPVDGALEIEKLQSRRCSSNSSLESIDNAINAELKSHEVNTDQVTFDRNRKKRRKYKLSNDRYEDKRPCIKRIKIAINGNVASERQISNMSKSNYSDDSDCNEYSDNCNYVSDEEQQSNCSRSSINDYDMPVETEYEDHDNSNDEEEYAVVQKPITCKSNHIVLTIKKTPSKINSPVNSMSARSPTVQQASAINPVNETVSYTEFSLPPTSTTQYFAAEDTKQLRYDKPPDLKSHPSVSSSQYRRFYHRHQNLPQSSRNWRQNIQEDSIDIELKHLFNSDSTAKVSQSKKIRSHRKLFFWNELCNRDKSGVYERIINYSSSSSSSSCSSGSIIEEDDDDDDITLSDKTNQLQMDLSNNCKLNIETDVIGSITNDKAISKQRQGSDAFLSAYEDENDNNGYEDFVNAKLYYGHDDLPMHNNGMLPTFNSIKTEIAQEVIQLDSRRCEMENCINNHDPRYNNNNLDLIKSYILDSVTSGNHESTKACILNSSLEAEHKSDIISQANVEYKTGIRSVQNDGIPSNHQDFPTRSIQQFKEWHQVLQLQSYNDEPLIVLPYVVLE